VNDGTDSLAATQRRADQKPHLVRLSDTETLKHVAVRTHPEPRLKTLKSLLQCSFRLQNLK
jgi:hypothetical protein